MKKYLYSISVVTLLLSATHVMAGNSELAPRKAMTPLDRAKIHSVQAQNWGRQGIFNDGDVEDGETATNSSETVRSSNTYGSSKSCVTNIGTTHTNRNEMSSGRYGPQNNKKQQPIVIKGDVISLCK